jgi:hypothetical protein
VTFDLALIAACHRGVSDAPGQDLFGFAALARFCGMVGIARAQITRHPVEGSDRCAVPRAEAKPMNVPLDEKQGGTRTVAPNSDAGISMIIVAASESRRVATERPPSRSCI